MAKFAAKVLLVVLFPLLSAHPYEWRVTDWSNCSNIGHQESLDWWSSPGDLKLSRWTKVLDYYPLGCSWHCFIGIHDFLETKNGYIYASTDRAGIFWTTDKGVTWNRSSSLADSLIGRQLAEGPDTALYVVGSFKPSGGGVFKSTNGGWTWERVGNLRGAIPAILGVSVEGMFTLFVAAPASGKFEIYRSTDGGQSWSSAGKRAGFIDHMVHVRNGTIYACGLGVSSSHGIYKTSDYFNQTWEKVYVGEVQCLFVNQNGHIYAGVFPRLIIRSANEGKSWDTLSQLPQGYIYDLDGDSYGRIYALSYAEPICVYRSENNGFDWEPVGDFRRSWFNDGMELTAFLVDSEDNIFVGGFPNSPYYGHQIIAKMGKEYALEGYYIGGHLAEVPAAWGKIDWDATLNEGEIKVKIGTGDFPGWENCDYAIKGEDISNLSSVCDGDTWIYYRVEFHRSREDTTPILHEIWVKYEEYVGIEEEREPREIPLTKLFPIEPNPAGGDISIEYQTGTRCRVVLSIYDPTGRLLKRLVNGEREQGRYRVKWDGRDDSGKKVASGIYYVKLEAGEYRETQKLLLLR